jgi:TFIIF-interacting CTD phosphatase-like protein
MTEKFKGNSCGSKCTISIDNTISIDKFDTRIKIHMKNNFEKDEIKKLIIYLTGAI